MKGKSREKRWKDKVNAEAEFADKVQKIMEEYILSHKLTIPEVAGLLNALSTILTLSATMTGMKIQAAKEMKKKVASYIG